MSNRDDEFDRRNEDVDDLEAAVAPDETDEAAVEELGGTGSDDASVMGPGDAEPELLEADELEPPEPASDEPESDADGAPVALGDEDAPDEDLPDGDTSDEDALEGDALDEDAPDEDNPDEDALEEDTADEPLPKEPVHTMFPLVTGRAKGYDPAQVDEFLGRARSAFEDDEDSDDALTAADVREVGFPLVRRGYQIGAVDIALQRVEDAFAARHRERAVSESGAREWVDDTREQAQEILDRLSRTKKRRFRRVNLLRFGYRVDEVDIVADRISRYLESGDPLSVQQVRSVAFRMQRRGYSERQVDAVLDAVVDVMLAVN